MTPEKLIQPGKKEATPQTNEGGFDIFGTNKGFAEGDGEEWQKGGEKTTGIERGPVTIKEKPGAISEIIKGEKGEEIETGECFRCFQPKSDHSPKCLTHFTGKAWEEARNYWSIGRRNASKEGFTEPQLKNNDQYMFGWKRGLKDRQQKEEAEKIEYKADKESREVTETGKIIAEITRIFRSIKEGDDKKEGFTARYAEMIGSLSKTAGTKGNVSREFVNKQLNSFLVELKRAYNIKF